MSELVTLGKKTCEICGRKDCNNPGWPSWGCMECYRLGHEREKARADAAEAEREINAQLHASAELGLVEAREALAAARREARDMDGLFLRTMSDLLTKMPADPERIEDWVRARLSTAKDQHNALKLARALAAPADGEEGKR